mmetsp:Transcript_18231/g.25259  ORF Transcript_18231/g.25259 Transcript_18231/m.25259 type:complete len:427 (+) Transcript_18231:159-1439(+)|eukprot:CAMPEP_0196582192 /NCGR_PEP_ID=MMETSP1081-20130531/37926_1 /TAXON_ID=36882 /ORGANISM="Pyramimonas amylifera, Strain CCMP720" /LENGTH=426 /DNA_ID=CAMNT_0041902689 /DNA_START=156 /DNA_END=1436 /DNA_ORIENTATION=+
MDQAQHFDRSMGGESAGYTDASYGGYGTGGMPGEGQGMDYGTDPGGGMMYDEYMDYGMMGFEFAFDANGRHITAFENMPNPKAQHIHTITRGFEKFAFPKIVRILGSDDLVHKQKGLLGAAELLATGESAVQCLDSGICAAITNLLEDEDKIVRERGAAALEVAAHSIAGCERILQDGSVAKLVKMLDDECTDVRDAAYSALVEAASRSVDIQAVLVSSNTLPSLVEKTVSEEIGRSSMALELLRCCLSGVRDLAVDALLQCEAIRQIKPLLSQDDPAVLEGATSVIGLLCVPFEGKEEAVKVGCVPLLVTLLEDELDSVKSNALSALMYLSIANAGKQAVVEAKGVPKLVHLLNMDDEKVLINVLQVVTNVAEYPPGREELQAAASSLDYLMHHHAALIQRYAAQAKRHVDFKELPYPQLRGEAR